MKLRSVSYLSKEGVKNLWANRLMTVASVGVLMACMVLIGLAVLISMNVNKAVGNLEQQNVIMAYFNDKNSVLYGDASEEFNSSQDASSTTSSSADSTDTTISEDDYLIHNEEEALALCDKLSKIDNVLSVEYVPSEEGLESIKEGLLEGKEEYFEFLDKDHGNPLSDAAKITLKDMSKFKETLQAIKDTEGVDSVQSQSDLADKINALKDGIGIAGVWIIAILLIISLVIVSNTIRVTMYSRKLEISIMKAVGATNSFIRLPFVIEGVTIGIISAATSTAILYFCYRVAMEAIGDALGIINIIAFKEVALLIVGIFLAIGVLSGIVGSVIMISKYLKKEGSEFTAI
ncbi:MAG: ABC transporter permease [Clostridia bacterium]|nr:ABC transporter permease [Clostridia bacterium]